jgi:hypothetical protein
MIGHFRIGIERRRDYIDGEDKVEVVVRMNTMRISISEENETSIELTLDHVKRQLIDQIKELTIPQKMEG